MKKKVLECILCNFSKHFFFRFTPKATSCSYWRFLQYLGGFLSSKLTRFRYFQFQLVQFQAKQERTCCLSLCLTPSLSVSVSCMYLFLITRNHMNYPSLLPTTAKPCFFLLSEPNDLSNKQTNHFILLSSKRHLQNCCVKPKKSQWSCCCAENQHAVTPLTPSNQSQHRSHAVIAAALLCDFAQICAHAHVHVHKCMCLQTYLCIYIHLRRYIEL